MKLGRPMLLSFKSSGVCFSCLSESFYLVFLGGLNLCEPNPCGAASCTAEGGVALCHRKSPVASIYSPFFLWKLLNSISCDDILVCQPCFLSLLLSSLHVFIILVFILSACQLHFLHKCLTDCDSIYRSLTRTLLSLPAVLSVSAVHHVMFLFCDFLMFMSSVSGYGSPCFCGRLNVRVLVKPSARRSYSLRVTRVATSVFGLCCFWFAVPGSPPALCCLHAKLWETYVLFPGLISLLSSYFEYWDSAATSHRFNHKLTADITFLKEINGFWIHFII